MRPDQNPSHLIETVLYSGELKDRSNKELLEECFDKVYGGVRFNQPGLVIEEMMDRIDNEDDIMKQELRAGILPKSEEVL
ncbi:hypothetical protein [Fodinibius sp. SL11]|uniref:hypothetical protein n=1 Tax=Fodinibius sp. SL11 TaxID=3425690 RepID=UPI003F882DB0